MDKNQLFNAIIIDTNAFDSKDNDFCGSSNGIIPSLFDCLEKHHIRIISHPVLIGETKKHIRFGVNGKSLNQSVENAISSIKRNKNVLKLVDINCEDLISKLEGVDLAKDNIEQFESYLSKAIVLPYCDPSTIFDDYFNLKPPFAASGNKKSEFPDAFIIKSVVEYITNHSTDKFLIISNDNDWKKSLSGTSKVILVDDIEAALQLVNNQEKNFNGIIKTLYPYIEEFFVNNIAKEIWFDITDYTLDSEVEVDQIEIDKISENYIPLEISNDYIVLQTKVKILVEGATTILDDNYSIWDYEENKYLITYFSVLNFKNASGEVNCEIHISMDKSQEPSLEKIRIIEPYGINLKLDKDNISISCVDFDLNLASESGDAAEDYHNH